MKTFELIYKELEYLLIKKLPDSIEKINMEHNDGIILKPFENTSLEENCIKLPSFTFNIEESEYSEKDRIIESTIYTISLEIKLQPDYGNKTIILCRYYESFISLLGERENRYFMQLQGIKANKIWIKIFMN